MNKKELIKNMKYAKYKKITITKNYDNTYSFRTKHKIIKDEKDNIKETIKTDKDLATYLINDYINRSFSIRIISKGKVKDSDMEYVTYINEDEDILKLIALNIKKSFPEICAVVNNNAGTLNKIYNKIETGEIQSIIVKEDNYNSIKYIKNSKDTFYKNYDLYNTLVIIVNRNFETKEELRKMLTFFMEHNSNDIISNITTVSRYTLNEAHLVTYKNGILYIRGSKILSDLFYIKKLSKEMINIRRKQL